MKLGAEPKKMAVLVGLFAVAGIVYWMNSSSDAPAPSAAAVRSAGDAGASVTASPVPGAKVARRNASGHAVGIGEFNPKLNDKLDTSKIDPTLRLDLLAKVQAIEVEGGTRSIFQVGQPPAAPVEVTDKKVPKVDPIHPNAPPPTPVAAAPAPPPGPPPAPPINLKYFGYSTKRSDGEKKAFFLDGEDIIVASEGDIIKKQYKVVRIGVNSVQMEDTASKSTQTIPLQQEAAPA